MLKKVVIVDYGLSNLFSVKHACEHLGYGVKISSRRQDIPLADGLILPGVGAFAAAMKNLHRLDLIGPLQEFISKGKPLLGICLGMQLLFEGSEEFGRCTGLAAIKGTVKKFPSSHKDCRLRIPVMGWNRIFGGGRPWKDTPLRETREGEYMYFVHSYYAAPQGDGEILTTTDYHGFLYCSAVMSHRVTAFQFHPEKSARAGLSIYRNWFANHRLG